MTDLEALKARLREMTPQSPFAPTENWPPHKAAAAIERLEAENAKLREALIDVTIFADRNGVDIARSALKG